MARQFSRDVWSGEGGIANFLRQRTVASCKKEREEGMMGLSMAPAAPAALVALGLLLAIAPARAEELPPQRTLEELKAEAQARADRNAYPLIGLKPEEVREALANIKTLDRDEWAAAWSAIGERYMKRAE